MKKNLPKHIAIIMDGNSRWAVKHGLDYIQGHQKAIDNLEPLVKRAGERGVRHLTLWVWSTENWRRRPEFVRRLMGLFRATLKRQDLFEKVKKLGGHLHVFGELTPFPADIQKSLNDYLKKSKPLKKKIDVNFCLNYGGRAELLRAFKNLAKKVAEGKLKAEAIDEKTVSCFLYTTGQPDPDLIIRTGGELRLSGFLPWQGVYAELYFTKVLFPDFGPVHLDRAIAAYQKRERRLGGSSKIY